MISFLLKQWLRNKERFILSILGVALISCVLIYLFSLTESAKGTVSDQLQKKWDSTYDLVVTPPNSIFSAEKIVEPNYLNGISGGISYEQYETIKSLSDIEVAAPISVLGYTTFGVSLKEKFDVSSPGFYKYTIKETFNDGFSLKTIQDVEYFTSGKWKSPNIGLGFFSGDDGSVSLNQYQLIVGIDPEEEAKLVGLDKTVSHENNDRYLTKEDEAIVVADRNYELPVLLNEHSFSNSQFEVTLEKLALPFNTPEEQQSALSKIQEGNGKEYLSEVETEKIDSFTLSGKQLEELIFDTLEQQNPEANVEVHGTQLIYNSSPLNYSPTSSPFAERWSAAFEVSDEPLSLHELFQDFLPKEGFRQAQLVRHVENEAGVPLLPILKMNVVGTYSNETLLVNNDPLTELPLETYRPAQADIVLGPDGKPLNPAKKLNSSGVPTGLLTNPPNLLTTIKATEAITGGNSISSIRLKVKGIETLDNASQQKLEDVKSEIEDSTGLQVIITRGSSPQPTITKVTEHGKTVGWIEQPWIHLGASITILRETSLGYSSVLMAVLLIGSMYVFSTTYVSYLTRKKEYSTFLALGWQTNMLRKMILLESFFYVCLISCIALLVEIVLFMNGLPFNLGKVGLIFGAATIIYGLGIVLPLIQVGKLTPYAGMKKGEISKKAKRIFSNHLLFGFVLNQIRQRPGRNILSIFAIALPSTLISFYLFVSLRLNGILYTSYLGEFVAVEVNKSHYIIVAAALIVSALTTAEMMWQNIEERQIEIALYKSVGWKNGSVAKTILFEGAFIGFLAGLLGVLLSVIYIGFMYHLFPWDSLLILSVTILLPIIIGVLGAVVPMIKSVKTDSYSVLKDSA